MIRGRILYLDGHSAWLARGLTLLRSRNSGAEWAVEARMPVSILGKLAASNRLGRRLLRAGIHHFLPGPCDTAIVNSGIFQRNSPDANFELVGAVRGSRPLAIATDGQLTCYGEYRGNSKRSAVHIWGTWNGGTAWQPIWRFDHVRHVHGVYFDPYGGAFWITTGDDDDEAGLWVTHDQFRTVDQVVGGNQQVRAVALCFTDDYVYFGSDTPLAVNHIYRIHRRDGHLERLQNVGSSVFFCCKVANHLFFSTAVEPSVVNRIHRAEIWHSVDGERWELLETRMKDRWPPKLFQYGQVLFPAGPGDDKHLFFTPYAAIGDQQSFVVPVDELHN